LEPDPSKNFLFFSMENLESSEYGELGPQHDQRILEQNKQKNLGATFMGSLKLNKVGTGIEGSVA
jgi:hypothetical protein